MTRTEIEAVVRGLTKAQREALMRGYLVHGRGMWPLHNVMVDKGLFPRGHYHPPTDLGLTVRNHLKATQEDQPC